MRQTKLSTEILAYLAGYFDGEGTIGFTLTNRNYSLRACIATADYEALKVFADSFDTIVHTKKQSGSHRQMFEVRFYSKRAQDVIRQLLPFMRTKRAVAEAVLRIEFVDHSTAAKVGIPPEEKVKRAEVAAFVSAYNQRVTLLETTNKAGEVN